MANHNDPVQIQINELRSAKNKLEETLETMADNINSIKTSVALLAQTQARMQAAGESPLCKIHAAKVDEVTKRQSALETTVNRWAGGLTLAILCVAPLTAIVLHFLNNKKP